MKRLVNLEILSLKGIAFSGSLAPLQNLQKLSLIDIGNTSLDSDIECLPTNLRTIHAEGMQEIQKELESFKRPERRDTKFESFISPESDYCYDYQAWRENIWTKLHYSKGYLDERKKEVIEELENFIKLREVSLHDLDSKWWNYKEQIYNLTSSNKIMKFKSQFMQGVLEVTGARILAVRMKYINKIELELQAQKEGLTDLINLKEKKAKEIEEEVIKEKKKGLMSVFRKKKDPIEEMERKIKIKQSEVDEWEKEREKQLKELESSEKEVTEEIIRTLEFMKQTENFFSQQDTSPKASSSNSKTQKIVMANTQEWLDKNYPLEGKKGFLLNTKPRAEIKKLDIGNKKLEGELDLTDFVSLEKITVWHNKLTDLNINNFSNIRKVFAYNNLLTNLDFLDKLNPENLTHLRIGDNKLKGDLSVFSRFSNLEVLTIGSGYGSEYKERKKNGHCNFFTGFLESLTNLRKLKELDVSNNDIGGNLESLQNMSELETLYICSTKIDFGLEFLPDDLRLLFCEGCTNLEGILKNGNDIQFYHYLYT